MKVLAALVLLAGCITSSHAYISLNGTAFEYDAPGAFWVAEVGDIRKWEDVTFAADPEIEVRGPRGDTTIDEEAAAIASGPIEVGQAFRFCAQDAQQVTLSVQAGHGGTSVVLRMGTC